MMEVLNASLLFTKLDKVENVLGWVSITHFEKNILHFSTGQLSEAQEQAKIKTSHHFPIPIDGIKISIQNYMVSKGS